MGLGDIIEGAVEAVVSGIFQLFQATLGRAIRGLLQLLHDVITKTPHPQCKHSTACSGQDYIPLVFGEPNTGAVWPSLWEIYNSAAQPYAYVLWFVAVVAVQFGAIFDGFLTGLNTEESKKKLFVAFIGITLWWPLGVTILAFSDALGELLMGLGTSYGTSNDSIGLVTTYDVVYNRVSNGGVAGLGGLLVLALLYLTEMSILLLLALLWMIRIFLIYTMMPMMPVVIALWAFGIPGMEPLQKLGGKVLTAFMTLAFVTIPGAVLVGFTGTIMDIVVQQLDETSPGTDVDTSAPDYATGVGSDGQFVVNQPDATEDPVGALETAMGSSDAASMGAATDPSAAASVPGAVPMDASLGEFTATILLIAMAFAIPLMAALGPFIMAKSLGGKEALGAAGFLANPAGSLMSGAMSAANAADKGGTAKGMLNQYRKSRGSGEGRADALRSSMFKKTTRRTFDPETGEIDTEEVTALRGHMKGNWQKKVSDLKTTEGKARAVAGAADVGAAGYSTGAAAASKGADAAEKARDLAPTKSGLADAAMATAYNRRGMANVAAENMQNMVRNNLGDQIRTGQDLADKANKRTVQEGVQNAKDRVMGRASYYGDKVDAVRNGDTDMHNAFAAKKARWQEAGDFELQQAFGHELNEGEIDHAFGLTDGDRSAIDHYHEKGDRLPGEAVKEIFGDEERYNDYLMSQSVGRETAVEDVLDSIDTRALAAEVPEIQYESPSEISIDEVAAQRNESPIEIAQDGFNDHMEQAAQKFSQTFDDIGKQVSINSYDDLQRQLGLEDLNAQIEVDLSEDLFEGMGNRTVESVIPDDALANIETDLSLDEVTVDELRTDGDLDVSDAINTDIGQQFAEALETEHRIEISGWDEFEGELDKLPFDIEDTEAFAERQAEVYERVVTDKLAETENAMSAVSNALTAEFMASAEAMDILVEGGYIDDVEIDPFSGMEMTQIETPSGTDEFQGVEELHDKRMEWADMVVTMAGNGDIPLDTLREGQLDEGQAFAPEA